MSDVDNLLNKVPISIGWSIISTRTGRPCRQRYSKGALVYKFRKQAEAISKRWPETAVYEVFVMVGGENGES